MQFNKSILSDKRLKLFNINFIYQKIDFKEKNIVESATQHDLFIKNIYGQNNFPAIVPTSAKQVRV